MATQKIPAEIKRFYSQAMAEADRLERKAAMIRKRAESFMEGAKKMAKFASAETSSEELLKIEIVDRIRQLTEAEETPIKSNVLKENLLEDYPQYFEDLDRTWGQIIDELVEEGKLGKNPMRGRLGSELYLAEDEEE